MTVQPTGHQEAPPGRVIAVGIGVLLAGVLVLVAAAIDPWLLVMMAGLGVVGFSLTHVDR